MTTIEMTTPAPSGAGAIRHRNGFTNTLASEWIKLTSLRSTYITLALGVFLSIATTAVASLAMGGTQYSWPEDIEPVTFTMVGNIFALIIFSVFGVIAATGEYASGMMRLTLTATPRRERVLLAKLLLISLIVLVFGMVATVGMFLVGQGIFEAYDMPGTDLADGDGWRMALGLGAVMPFFPIVGLALGVVLRSTAGAITSVLGLLWLPVIFGEFLPEWWRSNIVSLLPSSALDSFTISHVVDSPAHSDPVIGALIAAGWLVAFLGAAYLTLLRRDA
jgi:hypothetical protein